MFTLAFKAFAITASALMSVFILKPALAPMHYLLFFLKRINFRITIDLKKSVTG